MQISFFFFPVAPQPYLHIVLTPNPEYFHTFKVQLIVHISAGEISQNSKIHLRKLGV